MNPITFKVGKKLNLVNLLLSGEKLTMQKLTAVSGYTSVKELEKDLGQLFMLGSYPYSPDDLIEVDYDGAFLSLRVPVAVEKSIRLSTREWMEIISILEKDLLTPESREQKDSIRLILEKIYTIIPKSTFQSYKKTKDTIENAIRDKQEISFLYSDRKGKESVKNVEPLVLFSDKTDYLIAYCLDSGANKMYLLENMHSLKKKNKTFQKKKSVQDAITSYKNLVSNNTSGIIAELLVSKSAYYNLAKLLQLDKKGSSFMPDGSKAIVASAPVMEQGWFLDSVSRFGKNVIIQQPDSMRNAYIDSLRHFRLPELL